MIVIIIMQWKNFFYCKATNFWILTIGSNLEVHPKYNCVVYSDTHFDKKYFFQ